MGREGGRREWAPTSRVLVVRFALRVTWVPVSPTGGVPAVPGKFLGEICVLSVARDIDFALEQDCLWRPLVCKVLVFTGASN